jgi:hypothetical protein
LKVLHQIKSPLFNKEEIHHYHFLVLFSENYLACTTFNPETKYFLGLSSYEFENGDKEQISSLVQGGVEEVFLPYGKRMVSFSGPDFTLVPEKFLREESLAEKYYHINFNSQEDETILKELIPDLNSWVIYNIPKDFTKLRDVFNPDIYSFSMVPLLRSFIQNPLSRETSGIFINIDQGFFTISVFQYAMLQLCNSFKYQSIEDVLYHVMNVSKHFGLDPGQKKYYFSGFVESKSPLYKLLYKYFRYPVFLPASPVYKLDPCFNDIPVHLYHNLFTLALCE